MNELITNGSTFLLTLLTPLFELAVVLTIVLFACGLLFGASALLRWSKMAFFASIIFGLGDRAVTLIRNTATAIGGGS